MIFVVSPWRVERPERRRKTLMAKKRRRRHHLLDRHPGNWREGEERIMMTKVWKAYKC